MDDLSPRLRSLVNAAREGFAARYGTPATHVVAAPGRVNLIGDHTDYNGGLVLPMAIDRHVVMAADRGADPERVRVGSAAQLGEADRSGEVDLHVDDLLPIDPPGWGSYVVGVLAGWRELGWPVGGLRLWVEADVPIGAGLSSSAALEAATATLPEAMGAPALEPMDKARLCQRAEHVFAGVPCGIMDQVASIYGAFGHALLLDCASSTVERVPLAGAEVTVLVVDSGVTRRVGESAYAARREECIRAAEALGVASLRDVMVDDVNASAPRLPELLLRRARHVTTENARVAAAARALVSRDWHAFGRLMNASHDSLRDDFDVSCEELDALVKIARALGEEAGVFGSRMTGAGFGGCTVSLVRADRAEQVATAMTQRYRQQTRLEARALLSSAAPGARILSC